MGTEQEQLPSVVFMPFAAWNTWIIKNPKVSSRTNKGSFTHVPHWTTFATITWALNSVNIWLRQPCNVFPVSFVAATPEDSSQKSLLMRSTSPRLPHLCVKHLPTASRGHQRRLCRRTRGVRTELIGANKNEDVDVAINIRKRRSSENEAKWTHFAERWASQLSLLFVTVTVNSSPAANAFFQRWSAKVLQTILNWEIN